MCSDFRENLTEYGFKDSNNFNYMENNQVRKNYGVIIS